MEQQLDFSKTGQFFFKIFQHVNGRFIFELKFLYQINVVTMRE